MKRKVLSIVLASALAFSITACGSSTNTQTETTTASEQEDNSAAEESTEETTEEVTEETTEETAEESTAESTGTLRDVIDTSSLTSKDVTVRIGVQGDYTALLAEDYGWYEEVFGPNNIKIELITFNNGPEMNEAITAGELDLGGLGLQPSISGVANGAGDVVIYASIDQSAGTLIAVGENSDITTVEDLKGKKVAATIGSSAHSFLLSSLKAHGLSASDIDLVNISDFSALPTVVETGEVDAAAGYASFFQTVSNADNYSFTTLEDASGYGIAYNVSVATKTFAEQYPDIIETLIKLYDYEITWIYENQEQAVTDYARIRGIDYDTAEIKLTEGQLGFIADDETRKAFDNYIQFMLDNGLLIDEITTDEVLDLTYLDNALGR